MIQKISFLTLFFIILFSNIFSQEVKTDIACYGGEYALAYSLETGLISFVVSENERVILDGSFRVERHKYDQFHSLPIKIAKNDGSLVTLMIVVAYKIPIDKEKIKLFHTRYFSHDYFISNSLKDSIWLEATLARDEMNMIGASFQDNYAVDEYPDECTSINTLLDSLKNDLGMIILCQRQGIRSY
jgi:hypothetical protein